MNCVEYTVAWSVPAGSDEPWKCAAQQPKENMPCVDFPTSMIVDVVCATM